MLVKILIQNLCQFCYNKNFNSKFMSVFVWKNNYKAFSKIMLEKQNNSEFMLEKQNNSKFMLVY
jgi:hypothetical protein